jgi:aminoglycoside phosphotransferase (APT) family kinase protein
VSELSERSVGSKLTKPSAVDDADISTLGAALNPSVLAKVLKQVSGSQWRDALGEIRINVLKWHKAKRCTFEIVGSAHLIGKVYAKDRPQVYEVMEGLQRAGFGPGAEYSIPQPIAYLPSLRLLLQERVAGTPAREIFSAGDDHQRALAAERCARWLARFHALAPPWGPLLDAKEILGRSERKGNLICEEDVALTAQADLLLERLRAARPALGTIPLCAGHGDYNHYQVILAEGRTVVVDWDLYNIADPTHDVATFIVGLERRALKELGSIRALDGAAAVFLETYLASGGHSGVVAHLPFYKTVSYLRSASFEVKKKTLQWRERSEAMLDEGLRALEQYE